MERLGRYPVSDDLRSIEDGNLSLGSPSVNPGKTQYSDRSKLLDVRNILYQEGIEGIEPLLRETAEKTRVKTDDSKVGNLIARYAKRIVYYLNKFWAKNTGYIAVDEEPVVLEEMKEYPYILDRWGRIRGKIRGIYDTFTKKKSFNPELADKEAEAVYAGVHEFSHRIQDIMGVIGSYVKKLGPFARYFIEWSNDEITDVVAPQVYSGDEIKKFIRTPRARLATA